MPVLTLIVLSMVLHDAPDPLLAYPLQESSVSDSTLNAHIGPAITLEQQLHFVPAEEGGGSELEEQDRLIIAGDHADIASKLPTRELTISAWVSVTAPRAVGRHPRLCAGQRES